jgi:hypothetical protein
METTPDEIYVNIELKELQKRGEASTDLPPEVSGGNKR